MTAAAPQWRAELDAADITQTISITEHRMAGAKLRGDGIPDWRPRGIPYPSVAELLFVHLSRTLLGFHVGPGGVLPEWTIEELHIVGRSVAPPDIRYETDERYVHDNPLQRRDSPVDRREPRITDAPSWAQAWAAEQAADTSRVTLTADMS